jgi:glycosyltransferase involved in cell wall biosynthesis
MELCSALRPYGVTIALATIGRPPSDWQRQQLARLPHVQLFECSFPSRSMGDSKNELDFADHWLLDLEQQVQPDIVHLNDLAHGALHWQAPVLLVGHLCDLSYRRAIKKPPPPTQYQHFREIAKISLQRADMVVTSTSTMLASLCNLYGSMQTGTVIVNGRSFPGLLPAPELKVPVMEPMVFCTGSLRDEAKNIGALAAIADRIPWRVCITGEPAAEASPSVPINLRSLGVLSEDKLAHWLARASIFAAPAHYEPFGSSILEAARAGCALVLGDIANLRELWGDSAEYVDPDDPEDLLRTLHHLIDHPQRLREMMERAWRRAQRYSGSRMAAGYMHCYRLLQDSHIPMLYPEWEIHKKPGTGVVHS